MQCCKTPREVVWPQVTDLWKPVINTGIVDLAKGGNAWLYSAVSNVIIATALEDTLAASASAADTSSKKWKLEFLTSSRWPTAGQAWFHASQNHWLLSAWNYKTTDICSRDYPPSFSPSLSKWTWIPSYSKMSDKKMPPSSFSFSFEINVPPKCPLSKDGRHGGRTAWERDWWVRRWCGAVRLCSGQLNFANKIFEEKTIWKKLHLLYSVEALQTNDALDATSPSIAAGIIVTFTFAHTLQMSFITFIRLKWCVMVYGRIVTSSRPIDKIPYIFNR